MQARQERLVQDLLALKKKKREASVRKIIEPVAAPAPARE